MEIRYFAGFVDGEGSIYVARSYVSRPSHGTLRLAVGSTHRGVIQAVLAEFGGYASDNDGRRKVSEEQIAAREMVWAVLKRLNARGSHA